MTTAAQPASEKTAPVQAVPPTIGNIDPASLGILAGADYAFLDTETTGMDPAVDRIVEIAIVRVRNGVTEKFHTLVDPEMSIPATASAVHHITDETIAAAKARGEAPTFDAIADKVAEMLDGAYVIAHNRIFDEPMVDGHLGMESDPKSWLCTVRLSRHLFPEAPAHGNQVLRYWFKTNPESEGLGPHRAIDDVYVSLQNLYHLCKRAEMLQVKTLDGLHELCNQPIIYTEMTFGKHKGKAFRDIPSDYFEYALGGGMPDLDEDMRISMERDLARPDRKADDVRIRAAEDANIVPASHMLFGNKHNGKPMGAVPIDYLEWIERDNPRCSKEVRAGVAAELARRRASAPAGASPNGAAPGPDARFATPAQAVFARLSTLVTKGSDEEKSLLATQRAQDPEAALVTYLTGFAKAAPVEFTRVASLTAHAAWMHEVTGVAPQRLQAAAKSAARPVAPAPAHEQQADEAGGRKKLFAKRQADPDFDDSDVPLVDEPAPFEEASAPRRMRMR